MRRMLTREEFSTEHVIALAGNPNVGKSSVFNYITGLKQHTGNWTGKTIENAYGRYTHNGEKFVLVDLPGTYSLNTNSLDEEAARKFICSDKHEAVVVVADATALERNLILMFQILDIYDNVILCVNLIDEAKRKGISINEKKLREHLGIPVVLTNAKSGEGIEHLLDEISAATKNEPQKREKAVNADDLANNDVERYNKLADEAVSCCVEFGNENINARDRKIDRILTSKLTGIPIMLMFLALILWITISGANYPSRMLSELFVSFEVVLNRGMELIRAPEWLSSLLIGGMYRTLTWVISVMLPPMAIFFPLFTLLEDIGYLPRIAFNLDKSFCRACAHGKQALTTCMGFGCNAVGVTGCNIIDSPRERMIAILTNNFVPCNGRFSAIILLSTLFAAASQKEWISAAISVGVVFSAVVLGVLMTFLVSKLLSMTVLKGMPSHFTLELPPYRKPKICSVLIRSVLDRTVFVLGRAIVAAAPAGIIIWLFANLDIGGVSILNHMADFFEPFAKIFGLDGYILLAFILGIPANEIVIPLIIMSYSAQGVLMDSASAEGIKLLFSNNGWTLLTAVNTILFMLMHFPCATTLMTIKKETKSIKWTVLAFVIPTVAGLGACFITTGVVKLFQMF